MRDIVDYVRRCKKKEGSDTHETLHGVERNSSYTLCGKYLDYKWWVENHLLYTPKDVTCKKCKKEMTSIV